MARNAAKPVVEDIGKLKNIAVRNWMSKDECEGDIP
jgi:hypothetical protein